MSLWSLKHISEVNKLTTFMAVLTARQHRREPKVENVPGKQ